MKTRFETLITSYIANKVGISEGFLSNDLCEHLKTNLLTLNADHQLQTAGVGNDGKMIHNKLIRNDKIFWLDKTNNNPFEDEFFDTMDAFVSYSTKVATPILKATNFIIRYTKQAVFTARIWINFKTMPNGNFR